MKKYLDICPKNGEILGYKFRNFVTSEEMITLKKSLLASALHHRFEETNKSSSEEFRLVTLAQCQFMTQHLDSDDGGQIILDETYFGCHTQ